MNMPMGEPARIRKSLKKGGVIAKLKKKEKHAITVLNRSCF
jgi:hypothetical protein